MLLLVIHWWCASVVARIVVMSLVQLLWNASIWCRCFCRPCSVVPIPFAGPKIVTISACPRSVVLLFVSFSVGSEPDASSFLRAQLSHFLQSATLTYILPFSIVAIAAIRRLVVTASLR